MFRGLKIGLPRARGSRSRLFPAVAIAALLLAVAAPLHSTSWFVKPDGSGDVPTIQAAIDAAANGDTILLDTGTFIGTGNKDLDTQGKAITIASLSGAESTVIDCQGSSRGFFIHSGEDSSTVLSGVHITNGRPADQKGGGIFCVNSSPKFVDNIISLCYADTGSGGYFSNSNSRIIRTTFDQCGWGGSYSFPSGGGIFCRSSDLWVIHSAFTGSGPEMGSALSSVNSTVRIYNSVFDDNGMSVSPVVYTEGSDLVILGNDFTNNSIEGSTLYLVGGTAVVRGNFFGAGVYSCGDPASVYAPAYGAPGPVDVTFNCFLDQGNFYAVGIHSGEIRRNIFANCHPAVLGWEPNSTVVTNNVFYQNAGGCLTSAIDIEGYPDVMSRNIHVGRPEIEARYATSCAYACQPGDPLTEYVFISGYSAINPACWMVGCGKMTRTDDPQFCDPENGNFFLMPTSPCLVENDPSLGATHGALPSGCGVDDVLDIAIPADQIVRKYDPGDVIVLSDFRITNASNMETVVNYSLICEGPVRFSDQGNPFAFKGTTPVLQPGQSYTPPEAAVVVTGEDEWFDVTVKYISAYAPALLVPDTATTTFCFRRTVPVLLKDFQGEYADDGVHLWWSVAAEEGINGWRIYRRPEGAGVAELITGAALPENSREYRDSGVSTAGRYTYELYALIDGKEQIAGTTVVKTASPGVALHQNTPNPFAASTTIEYAIGERSNVVLTIYDAAGRRVRVLVDAAQDPRAGGYSASWDGKNDHGEAVASGVYVYRLKAGKATVSKKMMLLR
jgi:hypothetical protein